MAERSDFPRPGDSWFTWAEQVVSYFKNPLPANEEILPSVMLLRHQVPNELERAGTPGILMFDPVQNAVVVSNGSEWVAHPIIASGTWTGTIEDNAVRGVGNVSATTATGTFILVGSLMHITIEFLSISIAGLTAGNTAFIHGVALAPSPSAFTLIAEKLSALPLYVSNVTIPNLFELTTQLATVVTTAGYVVLRELRSNATPTDVIVSKINGGDIYINGVFKV